VGWHPWRESESDAMSFTLISLCGDDCKCGYCHICYWAGAPTNYDPRFFPCGDPMWGIQLPSATPDGKPCTTTTGFLNIGLSGTWWSFSDGPLTEPPLFPPPVAFEFVVNGVPNVVYEFDPQSGLVTNFHPGTPALSGNRGPDGVPIYESTWGATMQIGLSCIQLASAANPYKDHTYDPAGGVAVYPYTGPRPDPGSSMSWGFNDSSASQFFSENYNDFGHPGVWVPDFGRSSDMYQGVLGHVIGHTILGREFVNPPSVPP
jgi:hypothetical protein